MVVKNPFPEGVGFPTFHACCRHRYPIDPTPLDRHVAADILKAGSPEKLALSIDMVDVDIAVLVGVQITLNIMRARNAEIGHRLELFEKVGKKILAKRDVGIDVTNDRK